MPKKSRQQRKRILERIKKKQALDKSKRKKKFLYLKNTKQLSAHYENLRDDKEKKKEALKPKQIKKPKQEIKVEVKPEQIKVELKPKEKIIKSKKLSLWQKVKKFVT